MRRAVVQTDGGQPRDAASRAGTARPAPRVLLERGHAGAVGRTLLRFGVRPLLVAADLLAWAAATLLTGPPAGRHLVLLGLLLGLYAAAGLYRSRLSLSVLDDLPSLCGRAFAAAAAVTSVGVLLEGGSGDGAMLLAAAVLSVLVTMLRGLVYALVRNVRARGWVNHPALVLGAGRVGGQLAALLQEHPHYGLRPVGFLDSDPLLAEDERTVPLLGGQESLASIIVEFGVQDVIVAFGALPESGMVDIIRTCDRLDVEIFFVPRLFELHATSRDMDQVWGIPLVRLRRAAFRSWSWRLKRAVDVLAAAAALAVLAPLLATIALAVRWEGGPGVLFRQERVGLDGRPFLLLKFRSLRPADDSESATHWNIAHDGRVGPVGRFLRATSLDELPQLWNVLTGTMTLVGPRPERPFFVQTFARSLPRYTARHRVPAGLTGWAQVHGLRGDTSIEDRARFDNYYIENWSLWTDVKILVRTISAVVRRTGG